jgi:hypothetical protein
MRSISLLLRIFTWAQMARSAFVCAALFAVTAICMQAQIPSHEKPGEAMQTFVIIFRQSPPTPTPEERRRTASDVVEWAQRVNADGHKLDLRILAPEGSIRGEQGGASLPADEWPVIALLFLDAHDLDEATRIAQSHPALRNRAVVEVRPWNPPVRTTAAPTATR